ncbi:hypothetical protein B0H17DRAFT_1199179 [Mycena rosella]|uniref:Uncharacterized protein n=1 Tax=Mycena rosella TaxID=1033263 RepID=A0AAD7DMA0_MYCRO|nr:hypothetical protein B0H17DRAFT_1199179 [Mycena rosella]
MAEQGEMPQAGPDAVLKDISTLAQAKAEILLLRARLRVQAGAWRTPDTDAPPVPLPPALRALDITDFISAASTRDGHFAAGPASGGGCGHQFDLRSGLRRGFDAGDWGHGGDAAAAYDYNYSYAETAASHGAYGDDARSDEPAVADSRPNSLSAPVPVAYDPRRGASQLLDELPLPA